ADDEESAEPDLTAEEEQALAEAAESGEPVEVASATDERSQVFANPDGTFTLETHASPVRVRTPEGWAEVDTTLVRTPDGRVRPRAAAVDMAFSGGGDDALARVALGGRSVELGWLGTLPEPVLVEDRATYPDVLPDVDLVLTAGVDGFAQVLVVHTPEAAAHPELAELELPLRGEGVQVTSDAGGNINAVTADGESVFTASAPAMWDSSSADADGSTQEDTTGTDGGTDTDMGALALAPATGARVAQLGTRLTDEAIVLEPDQDLLTDAATEYPVFIDPSVSVTRQAWAYVDKKFPNTAYYNRSDADTGVGYEPQYGHTKRGFWRFAIFERTRNATIQSATLRTEVTHAFGCTNARVELWRTGNISSATTWNNQPDKLTRLDTQTVRKGRTGCEGSGVEFDATAAYEWGRAYNKSNIILGLYGNETVSSTNYDWRRFKKNPSLVVVYNNAPATPATTTMRDSHGGTCATNSAQPRLINTTTPRLYAQVRDTDSQYATQKLKAQFQIQSDGTTIQTKDSTSANVAKWPAGSERSVTTDALPEGPLIRYRARAHDQTTWGGWSSWCYLRVDTTNPETGPEVTSTDYPDDEQFHGSPGQSGEFTFAANGVADAAGYHYSLNSDSCTTVLIPDTPGGSVTVTLTPRTDGPNLVYARTVDGHGNSSACMLVHTFLVAPPSDPVAHFPFDEGTGTVAADTERPGETATISTGADWIRGRVGAVENPNTNPSPRLEGTAVRTHGYVPSDPEWDEITTSGPVVDTSQTFTVAAWVKLDAKNAHHTAIGQDGVQQSPFHLGYQHNEDAWVFKMSPEDAPTSGSTGWSYALSTEPARTGVWTHLMGAFDAATGEIALYVNGEKQGSAVHESAWNASGPVTMGRSKYQGAKNYYWPGGIDDVRFYDRLVTDVPLNNGTSEAWELANRFPALEGRWLLDEYAGTTATDASDHGLDATLTGDPATVWNTAFNDVVYIPGATLNGTDEYFTTTGPAIRTDASFSVAAWVRLDSTTTNPAALSQDGTQHSGFYLGAQNTQDMNNWVLKMPPSDTAGASGWSRALSANPPELGAWTHLAATFDATTRTLTLYVDGIEEGSTTHATPWHADGPVRIGAARFEGALSDLWNGDLADIHVYQGVLNEDDIERVYWGAAAVPHQ
ncbi:LamG-like jellyroll fold domain-containing protein, partial [Thermobifida halotolerans]